MLARKCDYTLPFNRSVNTKGETFGGVGIKVEVDYPTYINTYGEEIKDFFEGVVRDILRDMKTADSLRPIRVARAFSNPAPVTDLDITKAADTAARGGRS